MSLGKGLYETLITEALDLLLREVADGYVVRRERLDPAEAADRIALHMSRIVRRVVSDYDDDERVRFGVDLARRLVGIAVREGNPAHALPIPAGEMLRSIVGLLPDGTPQSISAPLTPLLDTALMTNAPGEPRVGAQLLSEIESADSIDVVMAFIRFAGIAPFRASLRKHCDQGKALRVLTTTYTGSTEARALEEMKGLGAEVRVSYDVSSTRLHAKAWLFHRRSGFSTGFVGSSNLTHTAQHQGLEWNVRVSGARNPEVVEKIAAVFESYWSSGDFVAYDRSEFEACVARSKSGSEFQLSPTELRLEPFQQRLLEQVALARSRGHHRNLLVSATGTGKTVMAAVDYAQLRGALPRARLLFVAHREEILDQSMRTFRQGLRDASFGELWVGGKAPTDFEHVFASIQTLSRANLSLLPPDHFDVVIVDEFHHAAAPSYTRLLEWIQPKELLGLTATPERTDEQSVLDWFDGRISAELRLWDAIDQHRLVPFAYFGIHDDVDLRQVEWKRGRGYDATQLSNLLTGDHARARLVAHQIERNAGNPREMRALGFCVSVEHARFMAASFVEIGIPAVAVWGESPEAERRDALSALRQRRVNAVFCVDLFNEGVDIPSVDTLLLLRPTDSPTLFLQQLGRGLRRAPNKSACTVLDFVGRHRAEFRFDRRLGALLKGGRREILSQIESGFPYLPAGCHMELDRKATEIVLDNIKRAIPANWNGKVEELKRAAAGGHISLREFLRAADLAIEDVYAQKRSWSDLREAAGLTTGRAGDSETELRRACGRLTHIDDAERIGTYRDWLSRANPPTPSELQPRDRRLLQMLVASLVDQVLDKTASLGDGLRLIWAHPQVRSEMCELLDALEDRVDHLVAPLASRPDVPLWVHARYTRREIVGALGRATGAVIPSWQHGVQFVPEEKTDLLAFTLDKAAGHFSPTTRYRDYAINQELIHWETQNVVGPEDRTGLRYRNHERDRSRVFLFARLTVDDPAFWFLGPASYVTHQGERPMAVTWRLHHRLPGDLYSEFAAAVA